jgi:hypothetical protein
VEKARIVYIYTHKVVMEQFPNLRQKVGNADSSTTLSNLSKDNSHPLMGVNNQVCKKWVGFIKDCDYEVMRVMFVDVFFVGEFFGVGSSELCRKQ